MNSDDAPQLGGQHQDNAPMISSVQTRIIVSARGAYVAGNLRGLIHLMDKNQQVRFRHVLLEYSLWHIDKVLPPDVEYANQITQELRAWFKDPSPHHIETAFSIHNALGHPNYFDTIDFGVRRVLGRLLHVVSVSALEEGALTARQLVQECGSLERIRRNLGTRFDEHRVDQQVLWIALRWQVEAAWAIMRGAKIPAPNAKVDDPRQLAYIANDLGALISYMSASQFRNYRQHLMTKAVEFAKRVLPAEEKYTSQHQWLDLIESALNRDSTAIEALTKVSWQHFKSIRMATETPPAVYCVNAVLERDFTQAIDLIGFALIDAARRFPDGDQWIKDHPIREWMIEVAWAILHDDPIPSLE